jgi:hypothetical protein
VSSLGQRSGVVVPITKGKGKRHRSAIPSGPHIPGAALDSKTMSNPFTQAEPHDKLGYPLSKAQGDHWTREAGKRDMAALRLRRWRRIREGRRSARVRSGA